MGIFTKREYLCDGIGFITRLRLIGRRYGMYRLLVARKDLPEEDLKDLTSMGVVDADKAKYFSIMGYKGLFKNSISIVDYYDERMRLFASISSKSGSRTIKYYEFDEGGVVRRGCNTITYEGSNHKGEYRYVSKRVNTFTTDQDPILNIMSSKSFYTNDMNDDNSIISIERIMNYNVVDPESRPKADLLKIAFKSGRVNNIVVNNQNDDILMAETELPTGKKIYIYKDTTQNYMSHFTDSIDGDEKKLADCVDYVIDVDAPTCRMRKISNGAEFDFDSSLLEHLFKEVSEAKYPEDFITKVITKL